MNYSISVPRLAGFPILVNDAESRLDVQVRRGHIYLTIYDEDGNVVVPTRDIPVK